MNAELEVYMQAVLYARGFITIRKVVSIVSTPSRRCLFMVTVIDKTPTTLHRLTLPLPTKAPLGPEGCLNFVVEAFLILNQPNN